jgi:hypothetical protein
MGLDMYLVGKRYLFDDKRSSELNEAAGTTDEFPVEQVDVKLAYWRKANAIHKWFVDNVQNGEDDCREYWVSREQLKQLRDLCDRVLKFKHLATEQLPTESGFFFGGTEADEWYYSYLEDTVARLDRVLAEANEGGTLDSFDFYYRASW